MIIFAWWLRTSSKFRREEVKRQTESLENGQLLSGSGFVQRIALRSLSHNKRIKIINQSLYQTFSDADQIKSYYTRSITPKRVTSLQDVMAANQNRFVKKKMMERWRDVSNTLFKVTNPEI